MITVGLDLSLTGTGVARIDLGADGPLRVRHCRHGSNTAGMDLRARSIRLRSLTAATLALCDGADLVAIETPAYSKSTGSATDRAGYWWMVVGRLTAAGVPMVEVAANTLKVYALGTGRGDKDAMVAAVVRRYGDHAPTISTNDECDALVLADMAARYLGHPLTALPATHTRAMGTPSWPHITERGTTHV